MLRVINGLKKINKNIELGQSKRRKIKPDVLPGNNLKMLLFLLL